MPEPEAGKLALVVEDNPDNMLLTRAVLRRAGYRTAGARSAEEAIEQLQSCTPDVVLMDIQLPGQDGLSLTRQLRADPRAAGIDSRLASWRQRGIRAVLGVPLLGQELVGVLIMHRNTPGEFTAETVELLQAFAAQSSIAIQNARLFRRLQEESGAIKRERQTLLAIMAGMSDGLIVVDPGGRIRYGNAKATEFLEVDMAGRAGSQMEDVLAELRPRLTDWGEMSAGVRRALARAAERPAFELSLGEPKRDLLALVFPISGGEGVHDVCTSVTWHGTDLARTKDELISVVSHELRTPLASLVGFAELLLKRDYDAAHRQEFLSVMYEEGRRLTALISDFLDLQRMESSRQSVRLRTAQIGPILERAVAAAGEDELRPVSMHVAEGLPAVEADPDRLQQVLVNLLSNARKYSPQGGAIRLSAALSRRGGVKVTVADHGLGLPADALPRLFEKFYRVDNSDRRSIAGTGLGLAICREIVAEHGGRILAESAGLGQGSSFSFTLPASKPNPRGGDVLIVEDDPGFARLLEAELATSGLSAVRAQSAEAALEQMAVGQPKAIVLDLMLPGQSGEDLLARLAEDASSLPPVVVVTVKELSQQEEHKLRSLGALTVLQKSGETAGLAARAVAAATNKTFAEVL